MSRSEEKHQCWNVYFRERNEPRLKTFAEPVARWEVLRAHKNAIQAVPAEMPKQPQMDASAFTLAARAKIRGVA